MYFYIQEVNEKSMWEQFLEECSEKTFLQAWNWGEFNKTMGEKIWRFGLYEKEHLIAVALIIKKVAKRGTFLLVPHGPVAKSKTRLSDGQVKKQEARILDILVGKLKEIAKEERAAFIRINPIWERNEEGEKMFRRFGFREASMITHPEASWKLDITLREEELLQRMRKTTRYLIHQTLKNPDIEVSLSNDIKDVKIFSEFHKEVSQRQRFVPFSLQYLENEFSAFHRDNQALLFFGKYKRELAAASFLIFWSDIAFYHHAASYPQYSQFAISYLLEWEAIKEAKRRGCKLYDFWGYVNPETHPKHPWAGPTLFKMGFGGRAHEYIRAQDFPLSWRYFPIAFFEMLRRVYRRL